MAAILIVEDDDDLRFLYEQALTHSGHTIVATRRAGEAMLHLTNDDFDALVLDLNLPDLPGLKVLEFMQGDVQRRGVPVIIVSASDQSQLEANALGAWYFAVKPLSLHTLLALVDQPAHGYELLERLSAEGGMPGPDPGLLYRTLRQMEADGLLRSAWDTAGQGPARRLYEVTAEGVDLLHAWAGRVRLIRARLGRFLQQYETFFPTATTETKEGESV